MEELFEEHHFAKNDLLIEAGQICRRLYFLDKGAVRGFYNIDGKDISQWFGFENDFVTSFRSFITRTAATEYIQVVEEARLWSISKEQLDGLLLAHPPLEKLVRSVYEHYYIRLEERYSNAHFKTASERYEDLQTNAPHILQRMPLGYIASYLGISAETLSRIRGKK
ncbi:MAG: Crp/Fnr family transcriptional regulator [Chitinophagaceae bacterium]|nr:MAG: Crp/Fnr family transcriptional regulator [Chitinophagaceae bacterium]